MMNKLFMDASSAPVQGILEESGVQEWSEEPLQETDGFLGQEEPSGGAQTCQAPPGLHPDVTHQDPWLFASQMQGQNGLRNHFCPGQQHSQRPNPNLSPELSVGSRLHGDGSHSYRLQCLQKSVQPVFRPRVARRGVVRTSGYKRSNRQRNQLRGRVQRYRLRTRKPVYGRVRNRARSRKF